MRDSKIIILFFVAICILVVTNFHSRQESYSERYVTPHQEEFLRYKESKLILQKKTQSKGGHFRPDAIPPRLCPLFFLPIPLNFADQELLETIPGIGPVLAGQILEKRKELGELTCLDDLLQVRGVGKKKAALLLEHGNF